MGTVGLSFGSPTSGAGFDVSTTVSQIVANLQNVETPWKTQLTSLESQDAVISNMGTLFSNLSNDMSSLTDFQGILAQKTGSSSNTNVLELTAASSSATAGTHTVAINSLAQTSSGCLNEITGGSDTLSGSITLKVGSGTAQTITLDSSDDTLSGLASAINSSNVGITASVLTDATGSRLSLVSGASGAGGQIAVSNNSLSAAAANTLAYSGSAGASTQNSTGTLAAVASPSEPLSGSISIQVGSGAAVTVDVPQSAATLTGLMNAINGATGIGVTASIATNSDGTSSLSLASQTAGSAGTLTVGSSVSDSSTALGYNPTVTGSNASLTVDGVNLTSASNTVTNLIPGVTFQLLAASSTAVQVVIGNDNTGVESTVNDFVTDYNSLIGALNTQEGNTSSGTAEPLFGSPTLSLLQQQLLDSLNVQSPNGYLDSTSSSAGATLADKSQMTIEMGNGASAAFIVGSGSDSAVSGTYYTDNTDTGGVDHGNTISGLAATINAVSSNPLLGYSGAAGTNATNSAAATTSSGTLLGIANENDTLTGSISIQVGSGTAQTIDVPTTGGDNTLTGLMDAINDADIGVTASIAQNSGSGLYSLSLESGTSGSAGTLTVTSNVLDIDTVGVTAGVTNANGQSSLSLTSETEGANGALTVTSALTANTPSALTFSNSGYTSTTPDSGTLGTIQNSGDTLGGSITIGVGGGAPQTITLDSTDNTLSGLMGAINSANLGVNAALNSAGTALTLTSGTDGSGGALNVTSNLFDASNVTTANLSYNSSSDINSLTSLGISVNNDGSLTFDANSLDSVLNSDYSGVVGFFQNVDSWGQSFSTMLTNAGTSSTTGILALASSSNSNIESTLNAEISKEQTYISAQQTSLTAELNSANEIMQQLPSQLEGVNELYSAITGYNQNNGG